MQMRILGRVVLVGFLVVLVTVTGRAAGVLLQGTVVDPAGIVVPGATVELLSGPRVVAKIVSGADGGFKFADVGSPSPDSGRRAQASPSATPLRNRCVSDC
jgi:hypothetical protein